MFNYKEFKEELRSNSEAKHNDTILKFDTISKAEIMEEESFWPYLETFDANISFKVPEEVDEDFNLLFRLVAASLSSEWKYVFTSIVDYHTFGIDRNDMLKPELKIKVCHGEQVREEAISGLWKFQIFRLFEIYITEQMNCEYLRLTDPEEAASLTIERDKRIRYYRKMQNEARQKMLRLEAML